MTFVMPLSLCIILAVLCAICSAIFSGLTLGLLTLDIVQLKLLINKEEKTKLDEEKANYAKKILPLRKDGNYILVTLLIGNVAVNSAFSILLGDLTDGLMSFLISTVVITVFGEIFPQAICARFGLVIGGKMYVAVYLMQWLLFPIVKPIAMLLNYILGKDIGTIYNKKQLKALVDLHDDELHILNKDEAKILKGALEFAFNTVAKCMTPLYKVFGLDVNAQLNMALVIEVIKAGYSRIPVFDNSKRQCIIGLLYVRDLMMIDYSCDISVGSALKILGRTVYAVDNDATLLSVYTDFKRGNSHLAVVRRAVHDKNDLKDPFYEHIGIITLEDILEEILQDEIYDEFDYRKENYRLLKGKKLETSLFLKNVEYEENLGGSFVSESKNLICSNNINCIRSNDSCNNNNNNTNNNDTTTTINNNNITNSNNNSNHSSTNNLCKRNENNDKNLNACNRCNKEVLIRMTHKENENFILCNTLNPNVKSKASYDNYSVWFSGGMKCFVENRGNNSFLDEKTSYYLALYLYSQFSVFSSDFLSLHVLRHLLFSLPVFSPPVGTPIFVKNSSTDVVVIVLQGRIKVVHSNENNEDMTRISNQGVEYVEGPIAVLGIQGLIMPNICTIKSYFSSFLSQERNNYSSNCCSSCLSAFGDKALLFENAQNCANCTEREDNSSSFVDGNIAHNNDECNCFKTLTRSKFNNYSITYENKMKKEIVKKENRKEKGIQVNKKQVKEALCGSVICCVKRGNNKKDLNACSTAAASCNQEKGCEKYNHGGMYVQFKSDNWSYENNDYHKNCSTKNTFTNYFHDCNSLTHNHCSANCNNPNYVIDFSSKQKNTTNNPLSSNKMNDHYIHSSSTILSSCYFSVNKINCCCVHDQDKSNEGFKINYNAKEEESGFEEKENLENEQINDTFKNSIINAFDSCLDKLVGGKFYEPNFSAYVDDLNCRIICLHKSDYLYALRVSTFRLPCIKEMDRNTVSSAFFNDNVSCSVFSSANICCNKESPFFSFIRDNQRRKNIYGKCLHLPFETNFYNSVCIKT